MVHIPSVSESRGVLQKCRVLSLDLLHCPGIYTLFEHPHMILLYVEVCNSLIWGDLMDG